MQATPKWTVSYMMEPVGSSPEDLRARMDDEIARWAPVIKTANVKLN
jgi:tripartite-type tricarboxylate transporter receptor subunit TctC